MSDPSEFEPVYFGDPDVFAWRAHRQRSSQRPALTPVEVAMYIGGREFLDEHDPIETAGVILGGFERWVRYRDARHWAPFHEDTSPEGVWRLIESWTTGIDAIEDDRAQLIPINQAFREYELTGIFGYGALGLGRYGYGRMYAVRAPGSEFFVWKQEDADEIESASVKSKHVDEATDAFIDWLRTLVAPIAENE